MENEMKYVCHISGAILKKNKANPNLTRVNPILYYPKNSHHLSKTLPELKGIRNMDILSERKTSKVWMEYEVGKGRDRDNLDKRKKIIHVNQHFLIHNRRVGVLAGLKYKPMITIKVGGKAVYGDSVTILGLCDILYLEAPLACGAIVVVQTYADIVVRNPCTFKAISNY